MSDDGRQLDVVARNIEAALRQDMAPERVLEQIEHAGATSPSAKPPT